MNLLKVILGAAAAGTIVLAFRDAENDRWLRPALPWDHDQLPEGWDLDEEVPAEEPVLGYDGMDRDTLTAWLRDSDLEPETLLQVRRYEIAHQARQPVLDTVDDLLGL